MIEVVAIDGHEAEAGLLRLGADFAQQRLFAPRQAGKLRVVVEVTGTQAPRPIPREQLAAKAGLFKSAYFHYIATISLANGFDIAVAQLMHELVHIAQVITKRYELTAKKVKRDGEKQQLYFAKWMGKKAGFVDDSDWSERAWEQEAQRVGQQLSAEFMALLYGTQSQFAAYKVKKELPLYEVMIALPQMPDTPPASPVMPDMAAPEIGTPEMGTPEVSAPNMGAPDWQMADGAPTGERPSDEFDDILSGIADDLLAPGAPSATADSPDALPADAPIQAEPQLVDTKIADKKTYVQGISAPRILKSSSLESKKAELAARGLLNL